MYITLINLNDYKLTFLKKQGESFEKIQKFCVICI